jgi:hypothetical protein
MPRPTTVCFSFLRPSHAFTFRLIGLIASTAMLHAEKDPGANRPDFIWVEVVEVHVAPRNTGIGIHGTEPSLDSRTGDTIIVRGHYKLTTQPKARLSFVQTPSKRKAFQLNLPLPWVEVKKGITRIPTILSARPGRPAFPDFFQHP